MKPKRRKLGWLSRILILVALFLGTALLYYRGRPLPVPMK